MDWSVSDELRLWVLPRGLIRTGGAVDGAARALTEGLNEHGLGMHALYLDGTVYEPHDDRPALALGRERAGDIGEGPSGVGFRAPDA